MAPHRARACPNLSELRPDAGRSASVTASVPVSKLASIRSAGIPVPDRAAGTRNVEPSVTPRCAFAPMTLPEIRLSSAIPDRVSFGEDAEHRNATIA